MKNLIGFFQNKNWFFITLLVFTISLPLSESFISISIGLVFLTSFYNFLKKKKSLETDSLFLWISAVYLLYIIGFFFSSNHKLSAYDLNKNLVFLILPISFYFSGSELTVTRKRIILFLFSFTVIFSAVCTLVNFWLIQHDGQFNIHKAGFISHIRFSFQLILAFWIIVFYLRNNFMFTRIPRYLFYISFGFILFFIFYQQSLTGVISFLFSILVFLIIFVIKLKGWKQIVTIVCLVCVITCPPAYLVWAIKKFYRIEVIAPDKIDKFTRRGNNYTHDFSDPMVENGRYVGLYVCENELREEWNKKSSVKYDSTVNQFPLKFNLMRYLTSRGLRKDADGINALNEKDIRNIENGCSNYIFSEKKFSIYPRIYQTIWEYYIFSKTGYVNYQSFSQRLEFLKAASSIIKHNFLFGVGTGEWKVAFEKAYNENGSQLKPELYGSSHNQYLNYLVKFGITGLIFILFCIIYPFIKKRKYKDPVFLLFLTFMVVANLGDSNFESHVGGAFFVFFYCIFLSGNEVNYLKCENETFNFTDSFNF